MALPRPASPRTFWADLKAFMAGQNRQKVMIGVVAALMPVIIVSGFMLDTKGIKPGVQIVYVQSWPADRPDDVIKKQNAEDQKKRDAILLERRRGYQRLAKSLGIEY